MDMNLNWSKLQEIEEYRGAWCAAVHGVTESRTRLSNWTTRQRIPALLSGEGWRRAIAHLSEMCWVIRGHANRRLLENQRGSKKKKSFRELGMEMALAWDLKHFRLRKDWVPHGTLASGVLRLQVPCECSERLGPEHAHGFTSAAPRAWRPLRPSSKASLVIPTLNLNIPVIHTFTFWIIFQRMCALTVCLPHRRGSVVLEVD